MLSQLDPRKEGIMSSKNLAAELILTGAAALAAPAFAHHSFSNFDITVYKSLTGTVRALEWENPHAWLWVNAIDAKGNVVPWGFEGSAPSEMVRNGFNRHLIKVGEKVTVIFSPLRDGRNGGSFRKITLADGTVLGGAPPGGGGKQPGKAPSQ
jgi:hypothetical protein